MGKQTGFLKHITEGTLVRGQPLFSSVVLPDFFVDDDTALGALKPCQAAQACGFTAARRTEQGSYAMTGELQIHIECKVGTREFEACLYEV